jgi:hypothetical protein
MTRKDYEKIARAIGKVRFDRAATSKGWLTLDDRHVIEELEDALADVFAADNDRFDRVRFRDACVNSYR